MVASVDSVAFPIPIPIPWFVYKVSGPGIDDETENKAGRGRIGGK